MAERYEYKVVEVRDKMIGGKISGAKLEQLLKITLPRAAAQGDHQCGPQGSDRARGTEGLLVTFERRIG